MIGDIRQWLPAPGVTPKRASRKFKIIDGYEFGIGGPVLHIEYLDDASQESILRQAVMLGSTLCDGVKPV